MSTIDRLGQVDRGLLLRHVSWLYRGDWRIGFSVGIRFGVRFFVGRRNF